MRPGRIEGARRRGAVLAVVLPLIILLAGCEEEGDTINISGLDCGLVRADLAGDWVVSYTDGLASLVNCDDPSFNGTLIDVVSGSVLYTNIQAFPSASGASFNVIGFIPPNPEPELLASVEADSCLSMVQTWEADDLGWLSCLGTLDLASRFIGVVCDAIDLDTDGDGASDTACDLTSSIVGTVGTP